MTTTQLAFNYIFKLHILLNSKYLCNSNLIQLQTPRTLNKYSNITILGSLSQNYTFPSSPDIAYKG